MKPLLLLAVTLGPLAAAPDPSKDGKGDLKKLAGDWTFTSYEAGGRALSQGLREGARWSVKGDKYTFDPGPLSSWLGQKGTIKLDPAKKPAAIDLAITFGPDKGKEQLGIYRIEGDTVTICLARPGAKERPTEFTSTKDNGHILTTIKRGKGK